MLPQSLTTLPASTAARGTSNNSGNSPATRHGRQVTRTPAQNHTPPPLEVTNANGDLNQRSAVALSSPDLPALEELSPAEQEALNNVMHDVLINRYDLMPKGGNWKELCDMKVGTGRDTTLFQALNFSTNPNDDNYFDPENVDVLCLEYLLEECSAKGQQPYYFLMQALKNSLQESICETYRETPVHRFVLSLAREQITEKLKQQGITHSSLVEALPKTPFLHPQLNQLTLHCKLPHDSYKGLLKEIQKSLFDICTKPDCSIKKCFPYMSTTGLWSTTDTQRMARVGSDESSEQWRKEFITILEEKGPAGAFCFLKAMQKTMPASAIQRALMYVDPTHKDKIAAALQLPSSALQNPAAAQEETPLERILLNNRLNHILVDVDDLNQEIRNACLQTHKNKLLNNVERDYFLLKFAEILLQGDNDRHAIIQQRTSSEYRCSTDHHPMIVMGRNLNANRREYFKEVKDALIAQALANRKQAATKKVIPPAITSSRQSANSIADYTAIESVMQSQAEELARKTSEIERLTANLQQAMAISDMAEKQKQHWATMAENTREKALQNEIQYEKELHDLIRQKQIDEKKLKRHYEDALARAKQDNDDEANYDVIQECAICYDFKSQDQLWRFPCQHVFCKDCTETTIDMARRYQLPHSCAICRTEVLKEQMKTAILPGLKVEKIPKKQSSIAASQETTV